MFQTTNQIFSMSSNGFFRSKPKIIQPRLSNFSLLNCAVIFPLLQNHETIRIWSQPTPWWCQNSENNDTLRFSTVMLVYQRVIPIIRNHTPTIAPMIMMRFWAELWDFFPAGHDWLPDGELDISSHILHRN